MKLTKFFAYCMVAFLPAFASCSSDDDPNGGDGGNGTITLDKLTIVTDKTFVESDGQDVATFKVYTPEGKDVTAEAKFFMNDAAYANNTFSSSEEGEFEFMASYGGELTNNTVTIKALSGTLQLPADPNPSADNFRRRVMGVQFTSTYCSFCPYVISAIHEYENRNNDVVFTALHSNMTSVDPMTCKGSLAVKNKYMISDLPSLMFNLDKKNRSTSETTASSIRSTVEGLMGTSSKCGISVVTEAQDGKGTVKVQANIKTSARGIYKVGVWLLEDGIVADQSNSTGIDFSEQGIDINTHNNAVRGINATIADESKPVADVPGVDMVIDGNLEYLYEFNLSELKVDDLSKCHVVVFVTDANGIVDNVVNCPVNGNVPFEYK